MTRSSFLQKYIIQSHNLSTQLRFHLMIGFKFQTEILLLNEIFNGGCLFWRKLAKKCLSARHISCQAECRAINSDSMIISRWQAPIKPDKTMLKMLLESEGLEPVEEVYAPQVKIGEHRHPFGEVRIVVSGELLFSISGNQFLLRAGDRLEVPANTKHWHINNGQDQCVCIYAQRPF